MFGDWSRWCGSPENVAGCLVTDHIGVAVLLRLHLMVDNGSSNNLALNTLEYALGRHAYRSNCFVI